MPSNNQPPEEPRQSFQAFDLRTIPHILIERSWVIVLCLVVAAFWTARTIQKAPVLYSATAMLQVEPEEEKVVNIQKVQEMDYRSLEKLQTIIATIKTRPMLERIVTNGLIKDPAFAPVLAGNPSLREMTGMVESMVDIRLRRGTYLIDVSVVHTDPKLAAAVANAVVTGFIRQNVEQNSSSTEVASEFLIGEANRLKKKLQDSELAMQAYREKPGALSLDQGRDTVAGNLMALSASLTQAKSFRIKAESAYGQALKLGTNVQDLLQLPVVAEDSSVTESRQNLLKAESDFAMLKLRYRAQHPKYAQALAQIHQEGQNLTNTVLKVPGSIKAALEVARASEESYEKSLRQQESAALELSKLAIPYNVLRREVESDQALYDSVLKRLKETGVTKELQSTKLHFAQPAEVPGWPFSPDKKAIISRGVMMGLAVGLLLAFAINFLDSSFKTVDQAEETLRLPVLTCIPQLRELKKGVSRVLVAEGAKSSGAEAFRTLRAAMSMLGPPEERQVFLFTSALPQEGKTFTSLNFAACLAQQGLRTVIIDGDLRRPAVEEALGDKGSPHGGVTDYLAGQKSFSEVIHATKINNLSFISAGTTAPNPAELLAQGKLAALIDEARTHFDRVVIDSAPIHAVSDTLMMLEHVQTVSVVARAAKTPRRAVLRCVQILLGAGAPVSGVILNRMPRRRGPGYYYDSYYDYRYYGKYAKKGVYGTK